MIGEISRCRQKWYNSSHCWFDWSETPATCDRAWSYLLEWDLMKFLCQAWFSSRKIHFCDRHFGAQNLSGMQRANHKPKQGYAEYGIITWIPLWNMCTQFHCVSILRDINCWGSPAQDLYLNNAEQVMNTAPKSLLTLQYQNFQAQQNTFDGLPHTSKWQPVPICKWRDIFGEELKLHNHPYNVCSLDLV